MNIQREFIIPLTRKEIIESATSILTANDLYKPKEISKRIQIISHYHFNPSEWQDLTIEVKEDAWELTLRCLKMALPAINEILDSASLNKTMDHTKMFEYRNALKMMIFIISQIVELFEADMADLEHLASVTNLAKKGKRTTIDLKNYRIDWTNELEILLSTFNILCQTNLQKLWNPPIIESNFINSLSFCFLKPIERKLIASNSGIRSAGARLLITLIKRFNYSSSCAISLCQLVKRHTHIVPVLVMITRSYYEDGNIPGAIRDLFNEICDYDINELEKDSTALNNVSQYLQDVAAVHHSLALFIIPMIKPCLERDPYNMRICALSVIGDLLQTFKGRDNLEPKERAQRDKLIRKIFEHVHDVNAFVRTRALQIIQNLIISRLIPVDMCMETVNLLKGENGAVNDISSMARKVAIKVLTAIITHSPISTSLNSKQLEELIKKEKESLSELRETLDIAENLKIAANIIGNEEKTEDNDLDKTLVDDDSNESDQDEDEEDDDENDDIRKTRRQSQRSKKLKREKIKQGHEQGTALLKKAFGNAYKEFSANQNDENTQDINVNEARIEQELADTEEELSLKLARQDTLICFLEEMLTFSNSIPEIIADMQCVLMSKNTSDAVEAISFFVTAKKTGIMGINAIMSQIATLSWSSDESIRNAAVQAIQTVYLPADEMRTQQDLLNIVNNLLDLIQCGTRGDHISLSNTLKLLEKRNELSPSLSPFVWKELEEELEKYYKSCSKKADKDPRVISESRRRSILLVTLSSMLVKPSVQNLKSKLPLLMSKGLGIEWDEKQDLNTTIEDNTVSISSSIDLEFGKHILSLLDRLIPSTNILPGKENTDKSNATLSQSTYRQPHHHVFFVGLKKILVSRLFSLRQPHYIPFLEEAVNIIFSLSDSADICAEDLLHKMIRKIDKNIGNMIEEEKLNTQQNLTAASHEGDGPISSQQTQPDKNSLAIPSYVLSRFFFAIGHIGMKQMIYLETDVLIELRLRNAKKNPTEKKKTTRKSVARKSLQNQSTSIENQELYEEDDSELTGASADDFEADLVRKICETELVCQPEKVLIASLAQLVVHACTYMNKSNDLEFQSISALTLAKLMLISSKFCEKHLLLLFTIAERHPNEIVRSNLVVALGDINRRFPNLMEPFTTNLYSRLSDQSTKVKINTLNTLSHLILNDMIRVKGQISAMAVCLLDENSRIAQLSRVFFKELGSKDAALYNVLPDIISRLSDEEQGGVSEEKFRLIVDYLFQQVQKDKQNENLVDKICARLKNNDIPRSCCDLAYCLRSMNFNDRMFKSLLSHSPNYFDKLHIESFYECFVTIITKMKNSEKFLLKEELLDFEAKIEEIHKSGVADEQALKRAEEVRDEAAKKKKPSKGKKSAKNTRSGSPDAKKQDENCEDE